MTSRFAKLLAIALVSGIASCSGGCGQQATFPEVERCDETTPGGICMMFDGIRRSQAPTASPIDYYFRSVQDCLIANGHIPAPIERRPTIRFVPDLIYGVYDGWHVDGKIILKNPAVYPHELVHYFFWASGLPTEHGAPGTKQREAFVVCGGYSGEPS